MINDKKNEKNDKKNEKNEKKDEKMRQFSHSLCHQTIGDPRTALAQLTNSYCRCGGPDRPGPVNRVQVGAVGDGQKKKDLSSEQKSFHYL